MPKAIWNGKVVAESEETIMVEGNHYFPPESINPKYFTQSDHHTICSWKGVASYYHIDVDNELNSNAAWYYSDPKEAAANIKGYVAFWKGVKINP